MAQVLTGSFQLMKSLNRSLILNTIRTNEPISRAELAKMTKLTPPTVSNLVKELINAEIIIESNQGESRGGRKPTMLVINAKNFYIIGLDVGPNNIKVVLTDLDATVLEYFEVDMPSDVNNNDLLDLMTDSINKLLKNNPLNQEKVIGIGVGMHGIVDVDRGISLYAPNLQLRDIPIKDHLEDQFNMVVKVENDVRAMALGELWFGAGKGAESVVCINVGQGIGAGIIHEGKLFHGEHFIAGEIGHMTIDIDGPRCSCGNFGCLQALAAGPYIAERAAKDIAIGRESLLKDMIDGDLSKITGELIYTAAKEGDPLCKDILRQTGVYLGVGITNMIHTINPDRIIIGGGVSKAGAFVLDSIKETIAKRALTSTAKQTNIHLSTLGDQATVIGAATLMLSELFATKTAD